MQREKRNNAGNRMAKLLDEEEECQDEFYKQNYGGFEETESDHEYQYEPTKPQPILAKYSKL